MANDVIAWQTRFNDAMIELEKADKKSRLRVLIETPDRVVQYYFDDLNNQIFL